MTYVLLFFGLMAISYCLAWKTKPYYDGSALAGRLLVGVVTILVFIMGMRIGADQKVIDSIASIGVISVLVTIILWVGTFAAIWIVRKLIGMDRHGYRLGQRPAESDHTESNSADVEDPEEGPDYMTILILGGTLAGFLIGLLYIRTHLDPSELKRFGEIASTSMMVRPASARSNG